MPGASLSPVRGACLLGACLLGVSLRLQGQDRTGSTGPPWAVAAREADAGAASMGVGGRGMVQP